MFNITVELEDFKFQFCQLAINTIDRYPVNFWLKSVETEQFDTEPKVLNLSLDEFAIIAFRATISQPNLIELPEELNTYLRDNLPSDYIPEP
jgi:hypothetical protein